MLPIKPINAPLYVVTCISNPMRYRIRYHLYRQFEKYVANSGAILYTIEQNLRHREYRGHRRRQPAPYSCQYRIDHMAQGESAQSSDPATAVGLGICRLDRR